MRKFNAGFADVDNPWAAACHPNPQSMAPNPMKYTGHLIKPVSVCITVKCESSLKSSRQIVLFKFYTVHSARMQSAKCDSFRRDLRGESSSVCFIVLGGLFVVWGLEGDWGTPNNLGKTDNSEVYSTGSDSS